MQLGDITFRESGETHLKGIIPDAGLMPALVPGMVDAGLVALREFGTKSFAEVIAPAIELADGYAVDDMRARSFAGAVPFFELWPTSKAHFHAQRPDSRRRRDFPSARSGAHAASHGGRGEEALSRGANRQAAIDAVRDYFYRGEVARKIDAFSKANGGLLRYEDMAAFKLTPEEPVSTTFHGYIVYKPSTACLMALVAPSAAASSRSSATSGRMPTRSATSRNCSRNGRQSAGASHGRSRTGLPSAGISSASTRYSLLWVTARMTSRWNHFFSLHSP